MSLINQMLQDLERRGAVAAGPAPQVRAVADAAPASRSWLPLLLLLSGAAALWFWSARPGLQRETTAPLPPVAAKPVSAPAAAPPPATLAEAASRGPVSRMSLELQAIPAPGPVPAPETIAPAPLPVAAQPPAIAAIVAPAVVPVPAPRAEPPPAPKLAAAAPAEKLVDGVPDRTPAPAMVEKKAPAAEPRNALVERTAPAPEAAPVIDKRPRQMSAHDRAENEYRRAANLMSQGRIAEAEAGLRAALREDSSLDQARHALVGLLVRHGRLAEAEPLLREGVQLHPGQAGFAMTLARLQVERGEDAQALATLRSMPATGQSPQFHGFLAALLQRGGYHAEAVQHYRRALAGTPGTGVWLMGLAISLEADGRGADAAQAFDAALASNQLTPDLQQFVRQKLAALRPVAAR